MALIGIEEDMRIDILVEYLDNMGYNVVKREPELKPCPVCGGNDVDVKTTQNNRDQTLYHVVCSRCGIANSKYYRGEAIEAWNALPRKGGG